MEKGAAVAKDCSGGPGCTTVRAGKREGSLSCRCCGRETCVGVWDGSRVSSGCFSEWLLM